MESDVTIVDRSLPNSMMSSQLLKSERIKDFRVALVHFLLNYSLIISRLFLSLDGLAGTSIPVRTSPYPPYGYSTEYFRYGRRRTY